LKRAPTLRAFEHDPIERQHTLTDVSHVNTVRHMQFPLRSPTPREQKRDLTRARLFEAALAEFRRVGFARANVSRIAQRAEVSRASFYFHFPTKEHVLLELQWSLEQQVVARLQRCETLRAALLELVAALIDAESQVADPDLFRDMLGIYVRRPQGLALDHQPFPVLSELGRRFATAARTGELQPGLDPAQATHLFLTSLFGYLIGSSGSGECRRRDLEALISLFLASGR